MHNLQQKKTTIITYSVAGSGEHNLNSSTCLLQNVNVVSGLHLNVSSLDLFDNARGKCANRAWKCSFNNGNYTWKIDKNKTMATMQSGEIFARFPARNGAVPLSPSPPCYKYDDCGNVNGGLIMSHSVPDARHVLYGTTSFKKKYFSSYNLKQNITF